MTNTYLTNDGDTIITAFDSWHGTFSWHRTFARASAEAQALADKNGAPVGLWERGGFYVVCEIPPEDITPDPSDAGWQFVAVIDPTDEAAQ